mmetsp:Transcript_10188/g.28827  ORF Transcript_10188/g.28827 Transcript_10188/m.28827 type:complete len:214 (-) Transcript_10188:2010-2651(-)
MLVYISKSESDSDSSSQRASLSNSESFSNSESDSSVSDRTMDFFFAAVFFFTGLTLLTVLVFCCGEGESNDSFLLICFLFAGAFAAGTLATSMSPAPLLLARRSMREGMKSSSLSESTWVILFFGAAALPLLLGAFASITGGATLTPTASFFGAAFADFPLAFPFPFPPLALCCCSASSSWSFFSSAATTSKFSSSCSMSSSHISVGLVPRIF